MRKNPFPAVTLTLPRLNKQLIIFAKAIHDHLSGNPNFPTPNPPLTQLAADITAFEKAETDAATKAKGTAAVRDAKKLKLKEDLAHLRDYVQSVVEAQPDPRAAVALIESAFMSVRKTGKRSRDELSVKNTSVSGTVVLTAKAVAPAAIYYWQYSLDGETWISAPETMKANTVISGLDSAETYYFRFRAVTRSGEIGFSYIVSLIVH